VSDSRAANFMGESVELDAIPPDQLPALVRAIIERHIDQEQIKRLADIEEQERETLVTMAVALRNGDAD
jgi:hypothetical protein